MNLRELARDKPCMVRLAGCSGGGETVILAHYRLAGLCGTGMKPPDSVASWACDYCHSIIDGRAKMPKEWGHVTRDAIRLAHAEGVMRTLAELERLGYNLKR